MKRNYMAEKEFRRIDREVENEMLADPVKRREYMQAMERKNTSMKFLSGYAKKCICMDKRTGKLNNNKRKSRTNAKRNQIQNLP